MELAIRMWFTLCVAIFVSESLVKACFLIEQALDRVLSVRRSILIVYVLANCVNFAWNLSYLFLG